MTPLESPSLQRHRGSADIAGGEKVCSVCSRETGDDFVQQTVLDEYLRNLVSANAPDARDADAICER
jgi:hypothetical protein